MGIGANALVRFSAHISNGMHGLHAICTDTLIVFYFVIYLRAEEVNRLLAEASMTVRAYGIIVKQYALAAIGVAAMMRRRIYFQS